MIEKEIEGQVVRYVESLGGRALKLRVDGENGFPDRTILLPNRSPLFLELKRPGGGLSPKQEKWLDDLLQLGHYVGVCWTFEQAKDRIDHFLKYGPRVP